MSPLGIKTTSPVASSDILDLEMDRAPARSHGFVTEGVVTTNGTVKWFDAYRGYEFIQPEDGSKDAFVHVTAAEQAGLSTLRKGQKVSYEFTTGKNGESAASNLAVND